MGEDLGSPTKFASSLVARPIWSTLSSLEQVALAACAVDTQKARICTATTRHIRNGRPCGVELQLWSLRTGELIQTGAPPTLQPDEICADPLPGGLYFVQSLGCIIGVCGMQLWGVDVTRLAPAGVIQAHQRQLMGVAVGRIRHASEASGGVSGGLPRASMATSGAKGSDSWGLEVEAGGGGGVISGLTADAGSPPRPPPPAGAAGGGGARRGERGAEGM